MKTYAHANDSKKVRLELSPEEKRTLDEACYIMEEIEKLIREQDEHFETYIMPDGDSLTRTDYWFIGNMLSALAFSDHIIIV